MKYELDTDEKTIEKEAREYKKVSEETKEKYRVDFKKKLKEKGRNSKIE